MIFFFSVMDVILKKKFIYFKDYKAKCTIGKRGIISKKVEGDKCTPRGRFKLKYIFSRNFPHFSLKYNYKNRRGYMNYSKKDNLFLRILFAIPNPIQPTPINPTFIL